MGNGVVLHSYPWYPSDWLKSETRMKLPLAGRSIYRDLLDRCWLDGSLPPDESQLAYIGGSTLSQFKKAWPLMIGKFFLAEDGRLHNQKVDDKRAELIEANERRRAAGRTGGQASAEVRRQPTVQAIVEAIVQPTVKQPFKQSSSNRQAIVKQSSSHPYPPPLPLPVEDTDSSSARPAALRDADARIAAPPETEDPQSAIDAEVERLAGIWPNPGGIPTAKIAAQLAFGGSTKPVAEWCAAIDASAASWAGYHRERLSHKPGHYTPPLARWFSDGDYSRPAPQAVAQKKKTMYEIPE